MSRTACTKSKKMILKGTMLCIDPSSGSSSRGESNAGWALFQDGLIMESGLIELDHGKMPETRLRLIADCVRTSFEPVDLLVIEDIQGAIAPKTLIQACGVYIASIDSKRVIQINAKTWQAIARRIGGWKKNDESDAQYIGWAAIAFALGYNQKESEKKREPFLEAVRGRIHGGLYGGSDQDTDGKDRPVPRPDRGDPIEYRTLGREVIGEPASIGRFSFD